MTNTWQIWRLAKLPLAVNRIHPRRTCIRRYF
jgi:hypothetical protein